jgi:hypothetical protein
MDEGGPACQLAFKQMERMEKLDGKCWQTPNGDLKIDQIDGHCHFFSLPYVAGKNN